MFGRVEGKLDLVLTNQSMHVNRIEDLESRQRESETRLSIIETQRSTVKDLWGRLIAIGALLVSVANAIRSLIPGF